MTAVCSPSIKEPIMDDLVQRLSEGSHPVELALRPEKTMQRLRECLERKHVYVKFTATRGGTELGISVDHAATDLSQADFDSASGNAHIVGALILNDVRVRCIADVDLGTFEGLGYLQPIE
jgi:hypothetical protein